MFGTGRDFAIWAFLPDSIPETKWHHLVGIYENRNWYLYQNDTLRETQHSDKYLIDTKNGFLYIGKLFEGKIDDIRFYNRALTKNEVDTLYHLGSSCGITTGIHSNDNKNHSFRISQNLETHSLLIESPTSNKNILYSITDLFGRVLQHGRISEKSNLIELTEINNGILILTIRDKNEILIQSKIFNN